jgi:glucose-6-phosphate 1-epimerase
VTTSPRTVEGPGRLPFIVVDTPRCRARLTSHGAQVCEWTPAGQSSPVLFLSPRAVFARDKAIRGGVPVCFPWFGPHPTDPGKPQHGFARTHAWDVESVTEDPTGDTRVVFRLVSGADTRALWDADFVARLTVVLGATLEMIFEVENASKQPFVYEAALHAYLAIGDIATVSVHGLESTRFLDKTDGQREKRSGDAPLVFDSEVDRTFLDTTAACTVHDPVLGRQIRIDKIDSRATVVWNPGLAKGQAMADLGEAWKQFVCVETANCGPFAVRLAPGARHAMTSRISAIPAPR